MKEWYPLKSVRLCCSNQQSETSLWHKATLLLTLQVWCWPAGGAIIPLPRGPPAGGFISLQMSTTAGVGGAANLLSVRFSLRSPARSTDFCERGLTNPTKSFWQCGKTKKQNSMWEMIHGHVYHRVFQPPHRGRIAGANPLFREGCLVHHRRRSSISNLPERQAELPSSGGNQTCAQGLPHVPWGQNQWFPTVKHDRPLNIRLSAQPTQSDRNGNQNCSTTFSTPNIE